MAKKTAVEATKTYAHLHKSIGRMTEEELKTAMQQVLDDPEPRVDMLQRLLGRYNKVRARKATTAVLGLLSYKGKRDVNAVLGNDR